MVICKTKMNCYLGTCRFSDVEFGIPQYFRDIATAAFRKCIHSFRDDGDIEAFVFRHGCEEIAFVRKEYAGDWLCFIEKNDWIPVAQADLYGAKEGNAVRWKAVAAVYRRKGGVSQSLAHFDGRKKSEEEIAWNMKQYFDEERK